MYCFPSVSDVSPCFHQLSEQKRNRVFGQKMYFSHLSPPSLCWDTGWRRRRGGWWGRPCRFLWTSPQHLQSKQTSPGCVNYSHPEVQIPQYFQPPADRYAATNISLYIFCFVFCFQVLRGTKIPPSGRTKVVDKHSSHHGSTATTQAEVQALQDALRRRPQGRRDRRTQVGDTGCPNWGVGHTWRTHRDGHGSQLEEKLLPAILWLPT